MARTWGDRRQGVAGSRRGLVARACVAGVLAGMCLLGCGDATTPDAIAPTPPLPTRRGQMLWIASAGGFLIRSADGGATWATYLGIPLVPNALTVSDGMSGWVVGGRDWGGDVVVSTSDGGATWSPSGSWGGALLLDVACAGRRHVWVVGSQGREASAALVLCSRDGGVTWERQTLASPRSFHRVAFVDSRCGWALGDETSSCNSIHVTTDGGRQWRMQYRSKEEVRLTGVAFADAQHGWVVGTDSTGNADEVGSGSGLILATSDGGAHWEEQSAVGQTPALNALACTDAEHAWAVGDDGLILATMDGGRSWQRQESGTSDRLVAVAFGDAENGWILVGDSGLLTTSDGQTWVLVEMGEDRVHWVARGIAAPAMLRP